MDVRVTSQRQPVRGGNADPAEQIDASALRCEDDVEARGLLAVAVEIEMGVDGPEGRGPQLGRETVREAVIDIQVEIESTSRHSIKFTRLEVLNFDESLERAVAVNPGRLGRQNAVKDQSNAMNVHGCLTK
jgi:hypothetical protein